MIFSDLFCVITILQNNFIYQKSWIVQHFVIALLYVYFNFNMLVVFSLTRACRKLRSD